MKNSRMIAALVSTLAIAAVGAGCGGDPIVGRWRATRINAAAMSSVETVLDFQGGGYVDITIKSTYDTAAAMLPGCIETTNVTMGGWSSAASAGGRRVMLNGTGVCRLARVSCRTPGDNLADAPCPAGMTGPGAVGGDYNVMGDTLNIALGDNSYVCMRQ